jgi:hypothetical protein
MELRNFQCCEESGEMVPIEVPSHSDPDKTYTVLIISDDEDPVCECEGYEFRGYCSHQEEALDRQCLWDEADGPEEQTPEERRNMICPRCGGPTTSYMELDDAEN